MVFFYLTILFSKWFFIVFHLKNCGVQTEEKERKVWNSIHTAGFVKVPRALDLQILCFIKICVAGHTGLHSRLMYLIYTGKSTEEPKCMSERSRGLSPVLTMGFLFLHECTGNYMIYKTVFTYHILSVYLKLERTIRSGPLIPHLEHQIKTCSLVIWGII